ncbi:YitT family protein [Bacillus lacus]|uniref:YitT family protein n=1 Tax=Metabacillus lacus TaxID=1983721 RepID=A0A7X2IW21_9BACI|nr:YitT family protein [Metabacillus lacus]MRX70674.1 YitT family protein [Metabacillus lacus]
MKAFLRKNGFVLSGGLIQGAGMGIFLFPHSIPSGGAGGLAVLLHYWFSISMGLALWIVNFSMLLIAIRYLGNRCTLWTMLAVSITSLAVVVLQQCVSLPLNHVWIDLPLGSLFLGTGVGLLMRQGVSNGGVGVLALIISTSRNSLPGKPLFWINSCIFLLTAFIIRWDILFLALLSQWISTKMVDVIYRLDMWSISSTFWRRKS